MSKPILEHTLRVFIRDREDVCLWRVREKVTERLSELLNQFAGGERIRGQAFWFDTIDGRSVALNLGRVQAIQFLWDPAKAPSDMTRSDAPISLCLAKRAPIEFLDAEPERLYDFFTELQHGHEVVAFPCFDDEDGERIYVNTLELDYVSAPLSLLEEGSEIVRRTDELDNTAPN